MRRENAAVEPVAYCDSVDLFFGGNDAGINFHLSCPDTSLQEPLSCSLRQCCWQQAGKPASCEVWQPPKCKGVAREGGAEIRASQKYMRGDPCDWSEAKNRGRPPEMGAPPETKYSLRPLPRCAGSGRGSEN